MFQAAMKHSGRMPERRMRVKKEIGAEGFTTFEMEIPSESTL